MRRPTRPHQINVRLSESELEAVDRAAALAGLERSAWARAALLRAVRRELRP